LASGLEADADSAASWASARRLRCRMLANTVTRIRAQGTTGDSQKRRLAKRSKHNHARVTPRPPNKEARRSRLVHGSEKANRPKSITMNGNATTRSIR